MEGQIRGIALGCLNYMFAGSNRGGELAAIIYSFIATCKLQKIDPAKWLDDVLRRIPNQPEDKLIELLLQFCQAVTAQKGAGGLITIRLTKFYLRDHFSGTTVLLIQ